MKNEEKISTILILIGVLVQLLIIQPIISNFFPIYDYTPSYSGHATFWGTLRLAGNAMSFISTIPSGWTQFGIPPIWMYLIFVLISLVALLMVIINWKKFKIEKLNHLPFIGIILLFIGVLDFFMLVLVFLGDSGDTSKIGFSPVMPNLTIGIGYWMLGICAIFIILGAITYINDFYRNH